MANSLSVEEVQIWFQGDHSLPTSHLLFTDPQIHLWGTFRLSVSSDRRPCHAFEVETYGWQGQRPRWCHLCLGLYVGMATHQSWWLGKSSTTQKSRCDTGWTKSRAWSRSSGGACYCPSQGLSRTLDRAPLKPRKSWLGLEAELPSPWASLGQPVPVASLRFRG